MGEKHERYKAKQRKERAMAELMETWILKNKNDSWKSDALCKEYKGTLSWFSNRGYNDPRKPKAVCERCSVQAECLQYALDNKFPAGIWGGKTADERLDILGLKGWGVSTK